MTPIQVPVKDDGPWNRLSALTSTAFTYPTKMCSFAVKGNKKNENWVSNVKALEALKYLVTVHLNWNHCGNSLKILPPSSKHSMLSWARSQNEIYANDRTFMRFQFYRSRFTSSKAEINNRKMWRQAVKKTFQVVNKRVRRRNRSHWLTRRLFSFATTPVMMW